MSALPKQRMTPEEYLAFERESDTRHEYYYGEVFAMVGASENHIIISGSINANLYAQLLERECWVYQSDMKVKINRQIYTYPDVVAVCGERQFDDEARTILLNPTVVIEVLSPSTEKYDRTNKLQYYHSLESLREYILVSQDAHHIEHYARQPDNKWLLAYLDGLEEVVELESIGCTLTLADVYRKITFDEGEV